MRRIEQLIVSDSFDGRECTADGFDERLVLGQLDFHGRDHSLDDLSFGFDVSQMRGNVRVHILYPFFGIPRALRGPRGSQHQWWYVEQERTIPQLWPMSNFTLL